MRNNNKRSRPRRPRQIRVPRAVLNGSRVRGPADPPSITSQPWNSVTLVANATQLVVGNPIEFSPTTLNVVAVSQLDLPPTSILEMRVHKVSVWNLSGTPIGLRTYDLAPSSAASDPKSNILAVQTDRPGRNRWANTSYVYSVTQRNNVIIGSNTTLRAFDVEATTVNDSMVCYIQILWRHTSTAPLFRTNAVNSLPSLLSNEVESFV